jgi:hypothetical protein
MLQGMNTLVTEFAAQNVPTVWFDMPNSDGSQYGNDFVAADHARITRYNALVDQLAARQRSVVRMHWADHINAFGPDLDRTMRPDGIHVVPERTGQLLDSWLWAELRTDYLAARAGLAAVATTSTTGTTAPPTAP